MLQLNRWRFLDGEKNVISYYELKTVQPQNTLKYGLLRDVLSVGQTVLISMTSGILSISSL